MVRDEIVAVIWYKGHSSRSRLWEKGFNRRSRDPVLKRRAVGRQGDLADDLYYALNGSDSGSKKGRTHNGMSSADMCGSVEGAERRLDTPQQPRPMLPWSEN